MFSLINIKSSINGSLYLTRWSILSVPHGESLIKDDMHCAKSIWTTASAQLFLSEKSLEWHFKCSSVSTHASGLKQIFWCDIITYWSIITILVSIFLLFKNWLVMICTWQWDFCGSYWYFAFLLMLFIHSLYWIREDLQVLMAILFAV